MLISDQIYPHDFNEVEGSSFDANGNPARVDHYYVNRVTGSKKLMFHHIKTYTAQGTLATLKVFDDKNS